MPVDLVGNSGSLASGSTVASRRVLGIGHSGDWGSAAGWAGGQHRRVLLARRHNRPAGVGVLDDQGLILYGEGIFTGLPIPDGDPGAVRDCPAGYTMDFEQSTFTETGGTDI